MFDFLKDSMAITLYIIIGILGLCGIAIGWFLIGILFWEVFKQLPGIPFLLGCLSVGVIVTYLKGKRRCN